MNRHLPLIALSGDEPTGGPTAEPVETPAPEPTLPVEVEIEVDEAPAEPGAMAPEPPAIAAEPAADPPSWEDQAKAAGWKRDEPAPTPPTVQQDETPLQQARREADARSAEGVFVTEEWVNDRAWQIQADRQTEAAERQAEEMHRASMAVNRPGHIAHYEPYMEKNGIPKEVAPIFVDQLATLKPSQMADVRAQEVCLAIAMGQFVLGQIKEGRQVVLGTPAQPDPTAGINQPSALAPAGQPKARMKISDPQDVKFIEDYKRLRNGGRPLSQAQLKSLVAEGCIGANN